MIKKWILAARPRTLPASACPVFAGTAYAWACGGFKCIPFLLCLVFALLAQIASNFANDYYDYKKGSDGEKRVGPRRAVASGDISPQAMLTVTVLTLGTACITGLFLLLYGGWWLIGAGILIAIGALAYSAGPYPLSYKGLGDVAVFVFFGLVAVNLTYYVQVLHFDVSPLLGSIAIGLLSVNILMVNNYRDVEEDQRSGKRTIVVRFGRKFAYYAYLSNGFIAVVVTARVWFSYPLAGIILSLLFLIIHIVTWRGIGSHEGTNLNTFLGKTARNLLLFTLFLSFMLIFKF
ncbi:1,4-dihydroxy-2-naphthoate polyprenyltransferase [Coprobacter tertius]|uniref:1,4-dihydroxy-2-naphthoate octaprenyltransferase n=1 Tax=Coprobacter tertius TaxID=2944915 RepID=A0ABT1MF60_9BACT|nr:1,4-dihydroxy-2-naphthoate polyprenyltransferase [Coprobacter tertius]MCP9610996.1 1,4-dihydroxy-2-naphthoate polyprenyltransferase [Coprobacter tertius]